MSAANEMSLSEATPEDVPTTGTSAPAAKKSEGKFPSESGFLAWAQGLRPIERVVRLYGPGARMGERDRLGLEREQARSIGDSELEEVLTERIESITEEMVKDSVLVTLQGVSPSRFKEITEDAKRDRKLRTDEDRMFYALAQQIVDPPELDYEWLHRLNDVIPTEIAKLGSAWVQINNASPDIRATIPL